MQANFKKLNLVGDFVSRLFQLIGNNCRLQTVGRIWVHSPRVIERDRQRHRLLAATKNVTISGATSDHMNQPSLIHWDWESRKNMGAKRRTRLRKKFVEEAPKPHVHVKYKTVW